MLRSVKSGCFCRFHMKSLPNRHFFQYIFFGKYLLFRWSVFKTTILIYCCLKNLHGKGENNNVGKSMNIILKMQGNLKSSNAKPIVCTPSYHAKIFCIWIKSQQKGIHFLSSVEI